MTREEAKELMPIIKAFAEGKTIELYVEGKDEWQELNEPSFDMDADLYRIKPELKYRPFKTQEECWEEMRKHPNFGWLKSKHNTENTLIGRIATLNGCPFITLSINEGWNICAIDAFESYTFTDNTPFGVKEE